LLAEARLPVVVVEASQLVLAACLASCPQGSPHLRIPARRVEEEDNKVDSGVEVGEEEEEGLLEIED
jgi:hypothetical protein